MRKLFVAASCVVLSVPAAADPGKLTGSALRGFVAGKTVVLNTSMGGIPITYRDNGTMQGSAGSLTVYIGSAKDHGTWWVVGDQVCQKWSSWLDSKSHCITFHLNGRVVHWRSNNGHEGTATIAKN